MGQDQKNLNLALIGCGAIANIHLPVIALSDRAKLTVLVDKFLPRARQFAEKYNVPDVVDDYQEIIGKVDAAIVALPHHLHAPVTIDLLRHGIHVLVEKPMALTTSDCDEMIKAASEAGAVLAVGHMRRFYVSSEFVKQTVDSRLVGDIVRFDFREGSIFNWPVASDFLFQQQTGGGVLADVGVHLLDSLLWWLGDYRHLEYYDDAIGGVEADCELHLQLQSGASGVVELSRTRDLRNTCIIYGERGVLEVETICNSLIRLKLQGQDIVLTGRATRNGTAEGRMRDVFRRQLDDFVNAVLNHREPFVSGREGRRAVELIEACYASRRPLNHPWVFSETLADDVLK